jgi:hypothetical protein
MAELNEKLLSCVLEHIEREVQEGSGKYNQNNWGRIDWTLVDKALAEGEDTSIDQTKCGTAACVAGWACMLSTPLGEWRRLMSHNYFDWPTEGQKRLGLTALEADYLFTATDSGRGHEQLEIVKGRIRVIRECREKGVLLYAHKDFFKY